MWLNICKKELYIKRLIPEVAYTVETRVHQNQSLIAKTFCILIHIFRPVGISENEAVEEAIHQSIEQHTINTETVTEEGQSQLTEAELMLRLQQHAEEVVNKGNSRVVVVSRLNLWKTALPYFKRNGFLSNLGLLSVTFATFTEEEDAVDLGGPRREFFHLLLGAICRESGTITSMYLDGLSIYLCSSMLWFLLFYICN